MNSKTMMDRSNRTPPRLIGGDQPPEQFDRRIGDRKNRFEDDDHDAGWPPVSCEGPYELDNDSADE